MVNLDTMQLSYAHNAIFDGAISNDMLQLMTRQTLLVRLQGTTHVRVAQLHHCLLGQGLQIALLGTAPEHTAQQVHSGHCIRQPPAPSSQP